MKYCIFCSTPLDVKSREHVIPWWLLKHLQIQNIDIAPTVHNKVSTLIPLNEYDLEKSWKEINNLEKRKMKLHNLVEGRVCKKCNNGWMSILEREVKGILIPLMNRKKTIVELNCEERFLIARWLFKTLVVLNSSSGYRKLISESQISAYYKDTKSFPKGFAFYCQQHHGDESFFWIQSQFWLTQHFEELNEDDYESIMTSSFKISLQLGKLILLMAYWPANPGWVFSHIKGIHIPLWGWQRACSYHSYENEFPQNNGIEMATAFTTSLGISKISTETIAKINNNNKDFLGRKITRNDFCGCGSKKKFKHCQGK